LRQVVKDVLDIKLSNQRFALVIGFLTVVIQGYTAVRLEMVRASAAPPAAKAMAPLECKQGHVLVAKAP
jgi:hypothetical protein